MNAIVLDCPGRSLRERVIAVERTQAVPRVDPLLLETKVRKRFEKLLRSRDMLMSGASHAEIAKFAGLSERRVLELFTRYLAPAEDGQISGERALNKGWRIKTGARKAAAPSKWSHPGECTGLFRKLLNDNEALRNDVIALLRQRGEAGLQPNRLVGRELRKALVTLLTKHGLSPTAYPLNTADKGLRSLRRWIVSHFLPLHARDWIRASGGPGAARVAVTPIAAAVADVVRDVYADWVLDSVKVELRAACEYLNAQGDLERVAVRRFASLRLLERAYGTTLAYVVVLGAEPTAFDVGNLFWRALNGTPTPEQVLPDLKPEPGAGFPANELAELRWLAPKRVFLDNTLAHLSSSVGLIVEQVLGAELALGLPAFPLARADVESHFAKQARRLLKRVPGTTGAGPADPLRKLNDSVPVEGLLVLSEVEHGYWAMLANENASATHATNGIPGLERLRRALIMGQIRAVAVSLSYQCRHMFFPAVKVRVIADIKHGRKPYVIYGRRVRYSSAALQARWDLVGKCLYLRRDPDDLRVVILFDEAGNEVCRAHGEGRWGILPHDERMRQMAFRALEQQERGRMPHDGPLSALFATLQDRAPTSPDAALKLAHCLAVLGRHVKGESVDPAYIAQLVGTGSLHEAAQLCVGPANDPTAMPPMSGPRQARIAPYAAAAAPAAAAPLIPRAAVRRAA